MFRNFKVVSQVIFGRGCFQQLDQILSPKRTEPSSPVVRKSLRGCSPMATRTQGERARPRRLSGGGLPMSATSTPCSLPQGPSQERQALGVSGPVVDVSLRPDACAGWRDLLCPQHEFVVEAFNTEHPIMKGLPEKWLQRCSEDSQHRLAFAVRVTTLGA